MWCPPFQIPREECSTLSPLRAPMCTTACQIYVNISEVRVKSPTQELSVCKLMFTDAFILLCIRAP